MQAGLTMGFLFSVGFPLAALVAFLVGETERGGGGEMAMDWNLITNSVYVASYLQLIAPKIYLYEVIHSSYNFAKLIL
ncbi:unnamed protein product [Camellia sinensis]